MPRNNEPFKPYYSKGKRISKSREHKSLYIIDSEDGYHFHAIQGDDNFIKDLHPPDPEVISKRVATIKRKAA